MASEKVASDAGLNAVYSIIQKYCTEALDYIQGKDKRNITLIKLVVIFCSDEAISTVYSTIGCAIFGKQG